MPWHVSVSVPTKVYDSRHEAVCICASAEQAALIVRAVNALPADAQGSFVKLREQVNPPNVPPLTHTSRAEGCCAKAFSRDSLSGILNSMAIFECPKCGTQYLPKREGPVVNWTARADVAVFRS